MDTRNKSKFTIFLTYDELKKKYMLEFIDLVMKFPIIDWSIPKEKMVEILGVKGNSMIRFRRFLRDNDFLRDDGSHYTYLTTAPFDKNREHNLCIDIYVDDSIVNNQYLRDMYEPGHIATNIQSHQDRVRQKIQKLQRR